MGLFNTNSQFQILKSLALTEHTERTEKALHALYSSVFSVLSVRKYNSIQAQKKYRDDLGCSFQNRTSKIQNHLLSFPLEWADDKAYVAVVVNVVPQPVYKHHYFIAETHQQHQVQAHPGQSAHKAAKGKFAHLYHRAVAAHGCHSPFIKVRELVQRPLF